MTHQITEKTLDLHCEEADLQIKMQYIGPTLNILVYLRARTGYMSSTQPKSVIST